MKPLRRLPFALSLLGILGCALAQNPVGPEQPPLAEGEPEIEITSTEGMRVEPSKEDPNETVIVYLGEVNLIHHGQGLDLDCDRLEVYFGGTPAEAAEGAPAQGEEPDAEAAEGGSTEETPSEGGATGADAGFGMGGGGDIRTIHATGHVVIVKQGADGRQSIARCGHAVYNPSDGTVFLTIAPEVQDDRRRVRATGEEGIITLREDGTHEATGGAFETILLGGASGR